MIYTPKKTTIHCFYSEIDRHRRPAILFFGTVTTAYRLRSRPLFGIIVSSHQNAQGRWILKVRAAFRKFGLAINEFLKKFLQKKKSQRFFSLLLRIKIYINLFDITLDNILKKNGYLIRRLLWRIPSLLFLFLSFTFIKIPTLRNFSTSVEIPSDRWPYNLTPSYPFYEHVSTTRSYLVYPWHLYISISKARAKFRHYTISWKVLVERATLPRFSINPRATI